MWPMKLDMTREECRGVLRRLELESYGTMISTFRAQGCLNQEKLRLLEDLRRMLHISNDRHRAEARRVANDERLTTVAEIISGPNSGQDWRREGHRSFPILPRTVPHTALTYIANTVFEQLTRANSKLPHPAHTSCDRLKKAEEMFRFELVRKESALFEKGFVRDAAVVTSDPLQDIMSKSYIKQDEKHNDSSKSVEKPTLECDGATEKDGATVSNGENKTTNSNPIFDQSSLCDILLNTNFPTDDHSQSKLNKSGERIPRKKSQATKRTWKSKSSYPPAKLFKHTLTKNGKQFSKPNNLHSPHLIHSYAVPFDAEDATANGDPNTEPPQLQQHLTSNLSQQNNTGAGLGQMGKSPPGGTTPSPIPNIEQAIVPTSKKDIQYNLFKLKPNVGMGSKGNVNVPTKGIGFYSHSKPFPHALLNYQRKSPSKNILIPTSNAAATLASLGIPTPLHPPLTDHSSNWISSKIRDTNVKSTKHVKPNAPLPVNSEPERTIVPSGQKPNVPVAELTSNPGRPTMPTEMVAESTDQMVDNNTVTKAALTMQSPVTNNAALPGAQPNLAGFTAVKSGTKLSVHKMQLIPVKSVTQNTPLTPTAQKNNVFILPKSSTVSGVLNLGQKITIPKSIVDSSTIVPPVASPPKVIVQSVPNPYNATTTTFDMNIYRQNTVPSPKLHTNDEKSSGTVTVTTTKELNETTADERATQQDVPSIQKRPASVTIPCDGVPVRKIKISTSQLVPFKGTFHTTNMPSTKAGCMTIGAKKLKIDSEAAVSSGRAASNGTDWENELDRANSTQTPNEHVTSHNEPKVIQHASSSNEQSNPSAKANTTLVHKDENTFSNDEEIRRNDNSGNALHRPLSPSDGSNNRTEQSEYDFVSTERGDDSSVTDSADAEDDIGDEESQTEECEGIEEDDFGYDAIDVEMETETDIIEEEPANYDHLIEEVPEDEQFVEEVEDGPMEFISVGYGTTRELVAELESTTAEEIIEEHCPANGVVQEELSPEINYDQNTGGFGSVENGDLQTFTVSDGIVCDLLEMGSDGKYHARPYSYKLAEGMSTVSEAVKQTHPTVR
ncbi:BRCA2-interacting transcriptional repressor EMSY [Anopheles moucheti]|uniref:BRCA2-interacting transcriptional repressor EMSY n=1 Tax=Anopheles moucheti TaxID=186751 RepID=UPI0022F0A639|nr:BRCA2-interacting transcriptional repressor EMSY [Anopheles moucheti]